MECVIAFRNTGNNKIGFVTDGEDGETCVFDSEEGAYATAENVPILRAYPWSVIELDI
jgi:hypothetical protein